MRLRSSLQRARRRQGGGGGGGNTAPGAPTIGTASAGNGTMSVTFTAPASNGGTAITGYTATLSTGEIATGSSSPINFTGLANGVARTATVTATNAVGTSSPSAASNSVTTSSGATAPGAPTIGTASAGNGTISVTFTASASDGGSPITSYLATLSTGETQSGSSSPINFTGLSNGVARTVKVSAINAVGTGPQSASSNSVTPSAGATVASAPTVGTASATYNDSEGNVLLVPFTAPSSDGGSAITSYIATLSTGETASGTSSPIRFVNNLSNGVARTATVKAVNGVGQSAPSAASNSVTPIALVRVASVESRGHSSRESRSMTNVVGLRPHIVGSGALLDFAVLMNGWVETATLGYTPNANDFTILEMSAYVTGGTPVPVTWAGATTKTVVPGDTEIISDYISASALLGGGATEIPVSTQVWFKFKLSIPTAAGSVPFTPSTVTDNSGSQYAFYDPANTTVTNTSATTGAYTVTGTALQSRPNGFMPQMIGHYKIGDPKTAFTIGDSIQQGVGDATPRTAGRGWVQYLMTDAGGVANPISCMNMGVSGDTSAHFKANTKLLDMAKYARVAVESIGTNTIGNDGSGNPVTLRSDCQFIWNALKTKSVGGNMPILRTLLQPQSTPQNPTKTLNSAPNSGWGLGGNAEAFNVSLAQDLASGAIQYLVDPVQVRQSSDNTQTTYWQWKFNGGTNAYDTLMTTDGTHPSNAGVLLWAASIRPTWNTIN